MGVEKEGTMNDNENLPQTIEQAVGVLLNNYQQEIDVEMQSALAGIALDSRNWQTQVA